jgi:hypothetical protein
MMPSETLEKSGDPEDKALVAKLHADLAEIEAAIEANRKAVLEQIREEAAAAERLRRQVVCTMTIMRGRPSDHMRAQWPPTAEYSPP